MINRTKVYQKYSGHCAYCGKKIEITEMQVDHMKSKKHGGNDNIENLNPSCRSCNHYKRSFDVENYRKYLLTLDERIKKNYINRVAINYGVVSITKFDGKFYFEKVKKV